jgi:hypothetical protein
MCKEQERRDSTRDLRNDRPSRVQRRSAPSASERRHFQALFVSRSPPLRMVEPIVRPTFGPRVGHETLSSKTTRGSRCDDVAGHSLHYPGSTRPSLPWRYGGYRLQPRATAFAYLSRVRGYPICHRLPAVATARRHKRSILVRRTFMRKGVTLRRRPSGAASPFLMRTHRVADPVAEGGAGWMTGAAWMRAGPISHSPFGQARKEILAGSSCRWSGVSGGDR